MANGNRANRINKVEEDEWDILYPEVTIDKCDVLDNPDAKKGDTYTKIVHLSGTYKNSNDIYIDVLNKTTEERNKKNGTNDICKSWYEKPESDPDTGKWEHKRKVQAGCEYRFAACALIKDAQLKNVEVLRDARVDPKKLKTSEKGIAFIKEWEGFSPIMYDCPAGHATIGYGHLIHTGKIDGRASEQPFRNGITKEKADELFNGRLPYYENGVRDYITVPLYQHEFDALVSLLFNCGEHCFRINKFPKMKEKLLAKQYSEAADQFADITNGGLAGLVKRRKDEINMFKNKVYKCSK